MQWVSARHDDAFAFAVAFLSYPIMHSMLQIIVHHAHFTLAKQCGIAERPDIEPSGTFG